MAFEIGMREIAIAVLAIIALLIFALILIGLINPAAESSMIFGQKASTGGRL